MTELELARPWVSAVEPIKEVAKLTYGTGVLPARFNGEKGKGELIAVMLYGDALGLSPIVAANQIYVINGTVTLSAAAMRALALGAGHEIVIVERGDKRAKVKGRRKGSQEWSTVSYTAEEAAAAGLSNKDVWRKHPAEMLLARATSILCRTIFADVLQGIAQSYEEVEAENAPDVTTVTIAAPQRAEVEAEVVEVAE